MEREESDATLPIPNGHKRLRFLAWQPVAITFSDPAPVRLIIRQSGCLVAVRQVIEDDTVFGRIGGSFIALEFHLEASADLLQAAHHGLELVDDFLSAISLIEGATLRPAEPVLVARLEDDGGRWLFVQFLRLQTNHWDTPIPLAAMKHARNLLAHWDGLDSGARLRRAARSYRSALGTGDEIAAFQHAYMALEALEKPLAEAAGIPPGVEEVTGSCANCGATYTRNRTTLAGVRAYVHGALHGVTDSAERQKEWKDMNKLRQELFHSLADVNAVRRRAEEILPATLHYVHDAVCCLTPLDESRAPLEVTKETWVSDERFRMRVPDVKFRNPGVPNLRFNFFWVSGPLSSATERDLEEAITEVRS